MDVSPMSKCGNGYCKFELWFSAPKRIPRCGSSSQISAVSLGEYRWLKRLSTRYMEVAETSE